MPKIGIPFHRFLNLQHPQGSILQGFGLNHDFYKNICPLEGSCLEAHNGIDMAVAWGSDLYAVEDGFILETKDTAGGYGMYVRLLAGENEWTYGHMSSVKVRRGQIVKKGEVLGSAGNTGLVFPKPTPFNPFAGTHLHLGLRILKNGAVQNYNNGYFGSVDFADKLPVFDLAKDDVVGFVEMLKVLIIKLQKAGIYLNIPK